jgi:hypothetical protein
MMCYAEVCDPMLISSGYSFSVSPSGVPLYEALACCDACIDFGGERLYLFTVFLN